MPKPTRSIAQILGLLAPCLLTGCLASSSVPASIAHATAADACQASAGSGWQVAVEIDRGDTSALTLATGASIATCVTTRSGGDYGNTSLGSGTYAMPSPVTLSYVTAQRAGQQFIVVGRAPSAARGVRVTFADGTSQDASLGSELWMAWAATTRDPVLIEAMDGSGNTIGRISQPNGIQPSG